MGPLSKLWFRFGEALVQENNMVQCDLNELIQYLEQSMMLVGQAFNVVTYNRRLNVLSAVQDKQKAKNIIKDQAELLEKPSVDLFGRVFRDHVKETAKVKKEGKEIYRPERPDQNKRPFNKGPSFSKQDGGRFATFTKKFDYQRQSGGNHGHKNRRFPGKKIQQKGNFLQQKHSSVNKTQQGRN